MDFWTREIVVSLKVRNFRVGSQSKYLDKDEQKEKGERREVDLEALPLKYTASSIKGLLKKSTSRALKSLKSNSELKSDLLEEIFGKEDREGKIQIVVQNSDSQKRFLRYGIKINPMTGSVEHGHLFSYSYFEVEKIDFSIRPLTKITKEEAKIIFYGLNYLRYETFGGFGSRGLGLIEDVEIDRDFRKFVEGCS